MSLSLCIKITENVSFYKIASEASYDSNFKIFRTKMRHFDFWVIFKQFVTVYESYKKRSHLYLSIFKKFVGIVFPLNQIGYDF